MALDPKELTKPLSKLRKLLRKMPKQPTPEQVHDLRTNTRRVEATLTALQLNRKRKGKRVLKVLTPLRKRAGDVRDMDVLTGFASGLLQDGNRDAVVQVLEHLGETRFRAARKLHRSVAKRRRAANKRLKRSLSVVDRSLNRSGKRLADEWRANATADALQLSSDVAGWPRLTTENLHPFRLKVKELRNVLKMAGNDGDLVDRLGEVKDAIGEWHDWTVLSTIANDALGKAESRSLEKQIDEVVKQKEQRAFELSNRMRNQYFEEGRKNGRQSRGKGIPEPILKSAAKLAEQERR
jgi:CHAD domain-containing protein